VLLKPALVTDRNRNQVADWANATRTRVRGWFAQLTATELIAAGRDGSLSTWALVLPAGTAVDQSYRVEVDGATYFVDGAPSRSKTPRGEHHVEARLRRITG
jgi:hypothetical protein